MTGLTTKTDQILTTCARDGGIARRSRRAALAARSRVQRLDEPVWAEIAAMLANPERLERMARQWLELDDDADLNDGAPMLAALRKQEATLERAITGRKTSI